jgi:hypothetical protein
MANYYGTNSDDQIYGGKGDDYLSSGGGDDRLYGDAGNDQIYGGEGTDVAAYDSDYTNFTVTALYDSKSNLTGYKVVDKTGKSGTDTINVDVEYLDFNFGKTIVALNKGTISIKTTNNSPLGSVTISGSAKQNETLIASNTIKDLDGIGPINYYWMSSVDNKIWSNIASGNSLLLTEELVGKYIGVYAMYTDGKNNLEKISSSSTLPVSNVNDPPIGSVTVIGVAKSGATLKASNSLTDLDGLGAVSYSWQSSVDGITWSTFATGVDTILSDAQVGKFIVAKASYTDKRGTVESAISPKSSPVTYAESSNSITGYSYQIYNSEIPANTNLMYSSQSVLDRWNNILRSASTLVDDVGSGVLNTQFVNSDGSIKFNFSTGSMLLNGVAVSGGNISATSIVVTNANSSTKVTLTGAITLNSSTLQGNGNYTSLKYESNLNGIYPSGAYGYTLKGNISDNGSVRGGVATELQYYTKNNTLNYTSNTTYSLSGASIGWDYKNNSYILSPDTNVVDLKGVTVDISGNVQSSLSYGNMRGVKANVSNLSWLIMGGDDQIILTGDGDRTGASGFGGNDYIVGDNGDNYFTNIVEGSTLNYSGLGDDTIDGASGYDIVFMGSNKKFSNYTLTQYDPNANSIVFIDKSINDNTGTDKFINIEEMRFSDVNLKFAQLRAFLFHVDGASGGMLKYGDVIAETINGTARNDAINGLGGNDLISGGDGNDLIFGGSGNDIADGGSGYDIFGFEGKAVYYTLKLYNGGISVSDKPGIDGTDMLKNFEKLQFADKSVIVESKTHGSYADLPTELYQFFITAFNAAPGVTYMDQLADAYRNGLSVKPRS